MLKKLLVISALFIAAAAAGQAPYFKNYKVRDGLPSNNVYFVFQDTKGYIWLCTDVGVSRFDGASFTNFTTANGLTDNEVFTCTEDREGRIWFATLNGKPCYFHQGSIHSEHDTPLLKGFSLNELIISIFQDENGEMVFGSKQQVGLVDFQNNKARTYAVSFNMLQAWNEPGRTIGVLSTHRLGRLLDGELEWITALKEVKLPVKHAQVGDSLYIVFARSLFIYSIAQKKLVLQRELPPTLSEAIAVSVYGQRLWIGDRKGAFLFDRNTLALQHAYLTDSQVSAILEDREGGWWFSTLEHGIYYVPAPEILHFPTQSLRVNCLSPDDKGRLWVGLIESKYGILDGGSFHIFQHYPAGLKPRAINVIRHFPDGTTYLAGKSGVLRIKAGQRSFFRLRSSDVNIDAAGNLWTGLTGLFFIPAQMLDKYVTAPAQLTEEIAPVFYVQNPPVRLSELRVDKIVFDHENTAWLASSTGLFTQKNGRMSSPLLRYPVRDLLFDKKQRQVWALTETNGLFVLRNGQVLDSIRIANSQSDAICRGLFQDEADDCWIATASGLFKVEGKPGSLRLHDLSGFYGMGSEKLNAVAVLNGLVYMGKDDGLTAAPLALFTKKSPPPAIYLKKLVADSELLNLTQPLHFDFEENSLTFHFEGLSFKDFKQLRYRYRLRGQETDWHTTTNEAVEYAALRPGNYRFEVLAVNNSGVESTAPAVLYFTIAPPFWMKWWFVLGMLAALAALVFFWVKRREQKLRRKYEMQRRLMESENERLELQKKNADLKMLSLRLQMNPHFIFNALNTIKGYYGQDKFTQASSYIAKFARLLRLNLDYSDAFIPLDQEIELLKIYLQLSQIRYPDKMDYSITVAPDLVPTAVRIPSMTIQPFVENAVIHGIVGKEGKGHISLYFTKNEEGEIVATVRDNGIGRSAAAAKSKLRDPHKPLATAITQERLQLLRKTTVPPAVEISDLYEDDRSVGTEVVLRLPMERV